MPQLDRFIVSNAWREAEVAPGGTSSSCAVSVIIPVRDDAVGLAQTLGSLDAVEAPAGGHEVIVVDDGSQDGTSEFAQGWAQHHPRVHALTNSPAGSYAARNAGIGAARGKILLFLDADVTVGPDLLVRVVGRFGEDGPGAPDYMGCRVEVVVDRPTLSARYDELTGFPVRDFLTQHRFAPTCCLAVRREVVDAVGPFDPGLESGGDFEFGQRAHAAGFRQAYAADIVVRHPARASYRELITKAERVARGMAELEGRNPERYRALPRRGLSVRNLLPVNPLWLVHRRAEIGLRGNTWLVLILPWLRPPLTVVAMLSRWRLRRQPSAKRIDEWRAR